MRYYVIADDGRKYGPVDVAALNQWIGEGRVFSTSLLEAEANGARLSAASVPGLSFPTNVPPVAPTPTAVAAHAYAPAYTGDYQPPQYAEEGGKMALVGIGLGVASIALNFVLGMGGILIWLAGMGTSWSGRKERPALAYLGLAINLVAAAAWIYLLIREFQTVVDTPPPTGSAGF